MSCVRRVYVEKQAAFDVRRKELLDDIRGFLGIDSVKNARVWIRYDVEHVPDDVFEAALSGVFAEPPVDLYHTETLPETDGPYTVFSVEALPGQYDQRADSAEQALRLIRDDLNPLVRCAVTYLLEGDVLPADVRRIQDHVCNPVDSRIAAEEKPETLVAVYDEPEAVARLEGFSALEDDALNSLYESMSLAMTYADFRVIRDWFRDTEQRDPSVTEIRVLDTYWSDHCRHTTFATEIRDVTFEEGRFNEPVREAYAQYLAARNALYVTPEKKTEKPVCLMDIALLAMKKLKADGTLTDMEESGENNACTVIVPVEIADENGTGTEEWLVFFKNETHNHPTEIEPFGGAAT
ncbi:MAG: phosphoribosylformylglycinamidine synthase, partial [Butyrivibrio sp.]|nr:phosphoribosylformylglycinamidine synthase [Butyrivibrio sp.]